MGRRARYSDESVHTGEHRENARNSISQARKGVRSSNWSLWKALFELYQIRS
jgi:hypothetical protein